MKNFRSLAATLIAAAVVTLAPAQQSEEIAALRAKAEKGNALAQYNLGLAYADGRGGVAIDRIEAYVWLSLARENGTRGRALDSLIATLDKASLETAQQRLAEQKALMSGQIPVVTTTKPEPEIVTTIKTTSAASVAPTTNAASQDAVSLSQQVATLTADKKQLSEEVAKAWKEIDALNAALAKAEKDARSANAGTSTADQENAAKFSRELEASLNRTNEQKSALEQNLAAVQAELARTKADLSEEAEKNAKLAAAAAARLTPAAEMAALRTQVGAAQTQIATLTADLAAVRASETNLHDNIAQLEQEKAQLAAKSNTPSYPDLSGKVGELEAQLARANQNTESATQAALSASKQSAADLGASSAEILRLQNALAAKSSAPSYPDLSDKVRELEASVADATQKLAAAGSTQSELERKLAEATANGQNSTKTAAETAQLLRERDELNGRVASLASESTQLRADRERIQKLLTDSGKQQRTADAARIKELETQTASLQISLGNANTQIASLQSSLSAKSTAPAYPDLSDKVRELEARLVASNQQTEAAIRTAAIASRQNTVDLNNAAAKVAQLEKELANTKSAAASNDLSGRVRELEAQLADASAETNRAKQEIATLSRARDEALKNRDPAYPNLAGRVVELQNALADNKRDLSDAQTALRAAEQARASAPVAATAAATEPAATNTELGDLQKQLAETENKLNTALRGYSLLQVARDADAEKAAKSAEAVTTERNALATQVATLTAELEQLKSSASSQMAAAQAETASTNESLAALQRSSAQNTTDLAATRALLTQLQGANTVLANENYQLKTRLASSGAPTAPSTSTGAAPVPVTPAVRTHVIAAGDTLSRISQKYYGTTNRWQEIYQANATKLGPNGVLRVGVELTIP